MLNVILHRKIKRGTWISSLSMFLCAILLIECLGNPMEVFSASALTGFEQTEMEYGTAIPDIVSDNTAKGYTLSDIRYDFCEIDYSNYANAEVRREALASAYLSSAGGQLDRGSVLDSDILYDPYVSAPDAITNVRNQGSTDTCWAFATTAAGEISSIRQGLTDSTQWLSPYHMAYFLYHHVTDPLGGTAGDTNVAVTTSTPDFLQAGGNIFMALFHMSGWNGLVKEEKAPYDEYVKQGTILADSDAYNGDVLLKNGYMISTGENQVQDIKQAIVDYGGVAIQFRADSQYKNGVTGAYYCNTSGTNHAAVIVGWDDNYSADNFNASCRPSANGAWIIKNSWGSSQGRAGYNFVSYEDQSIAFPIALEMMHAGTYDNNYHYDGSLAATDTSVVTVNNGGSVANIFTVKASEDGYDESLEAVSIALKTTDVTYKISIYKNMEADESGTIDPTNGKLMLTQEGQTGRAGIYTIPLEQSLCLSAGDTFSVVFTLESKDATEIEVWMEKDYDYGWVKGTANIQKEQSFRKLASNYTWFDLYYINASKPYRGLARIKAFTNTLSTITTKDINDYRITISEDSFVADGLQKCPEVTILKGTKPLVQNVDFEVTYQNNIEGGEGQVIINGIGAYTGTIMLPFYIYPYSVDDCPGHISDDNKCINCGYELTEQKLEGTEKHTKNYLDQPFLLDVSGNTTSLSYQSDNESVVTVDEDGIVTIKGIGLANIIVTAEQSGAYNTARMQIQVQVQQAQIAQCQLEKTEFYYDGTEKTPVVKVQNIKNMFLKQNQDYTVQYSNNKEIGTATVLVTGIGNYTGILKKTFIISRIPQELCSHSYINGSCRYCGYERNVQNLTGTLFYEKRFPDENFSLDMRTDGDGILSYESDDPSVVTVDEKGNVTIVGTGSAYIHVKAQETSLYYVNTAQILIEVLAGKADIFLPDSTIEKTYGSKSFYLDVFTSSNGKKMYKSGNKKVAVVSSKGKVSLKGYGKATLTITTEETNLYERGTKKITITVVPKKASLKRVTSSGNGKVCLTWKKDKTVDGYQIQYSTKKNFRKSVKTKNISDCKTTNLMLKLQKKKTYYFRIRSYKKVGKNTYYGAYSNSKKVKVK